MHSEIFQQQEAMIEIALLPEHSLSLLFYSSNYSCRVIFMNIITTLLQQQLNLSATRAAE